MDADLQAILENKVKELEAQLEIYKQKELERLHQQVAQLTIERDHFRSEANRNADIGRQIAANSQEHIGKLQSDLETQRRLNADAGRNNRSRQ